MLTWSVVAGAVGSALESRDRVESYLAAVNRFYAGPGFRARLARTRAALEKIGQLTSNAGVPLLVVLYPFLYHDLLGRYPLAGVHAWVMGACAAAGLRCLDAHAAFRWRRSLDAFQVCPVDSHPNGRANARVVELLAREAGELLGGADEPR